MKPTNVPAAQLEDPSAESNFPAAGTEWVESFVREMMTATSIDDARARATRLLDSLEKFISSRVGAEAAQNVHKENIMLKQQVEVLLRDNAILKRAVAIQHERQKESDERNQEVLQLKQLIAQGKEQLRTLENKSGGDEDDTVDVWYTRRDRIKNEDIRDKVEVTLVEDKMPHRGPDLRYEGVEDTDFKVNNYALKMHLRQAQQSNSFPGFNPDVF
ncbi:putative PTI1-like tyrosine-protein kinase-like [Capsicum annuum]|nr:putative PTI1-like tyrosine-protein kinase-like [Capsicum annuum]